MATDATGAPPRDIRRYLSGVQFPISRENVVGAAQERGAPPEVVAVLQRMAGDKYNNPDEVVEAYRQMT